MFPKLLESRKIEPIARSIIPFIWITRTPPFRFSRAGEFRLIRSSRASEYYLRYARGALVAKQPPSQTDTRLSCLSLLEAIAKSGIRESLLRASRRHEIAVQQPHARDRLHHRSEPIPIKAILSDLDLPATAPRAASARGTPEQPILPSLADQDPSQAEAFDPNAQPAPPFEFHQRTAW